MDLIEKNMILKTKDLENPSVNRFMGAEPHNDLLLNYGEIDETTHTLIGMINSPLPFTFTVLGDNEPLIPLQNSIENGSYHIISVNSQFTTGLVFKFQLKLEGSDFDIQLKLWKPYPISPIFPNDLIPLTVSPVNDDIIKDVPHVEATELHETVI